ncbi:DUF7504 family protein [Haladaptatus caseinilyticus]|uniref:DUF7504 family protein n=1 Tax=Haladaptatus caseinilyticus TaxID=2993314 RepID=UPI00224A8602|nr:hypothetical protein [Haladaptatus caseinilyticus]
MGSDRLGDDVAVEFSQILHQLKHHGCNLLLVGSVPDSVLSCASRKFFGDPEERRFRIVALSGSSRTTVEKRLPTVASADETVIITHATELSDAEFSSSVHVEAGVPKLSNAVSSAITSIETEDDLEPGELRVGLDSLESLLERYCPDLVHQFLGVVTEQIRDANGMGHFVFPRDYDHELVTDLAPLFDGVVEYRVDRGGQERWHFPASDIRSPWLPL